MERKNVTIPIIGIDERPNERQKFPGIATEIKNLRPEGLDQEPYWVPIPDSDVLVNDTDLNFSHSNPSTIVEMYWHIRGRVGKYGNNGSLKRLITLLDNGRVQIIDPNPDWSVVEEFSVSSLESGEWSSSFTQMYDAGYLCVSKGGIPVVDLIIEDDLIIENVFPELPKIDSFCVPAADEEENYYTQEEIDAGVYQGFGDGYFLIRYAFKLPGGIMVKHSAPEIKRSFLYNDGTNLVPCILKVVHQGYDVDPDNLDYWNDKISGISILISEFSPSYDDGLIKNTIYYELGAIGFIDDTDKGIEETHVAIKIGDGDISNLPLYDLDDGSHHKYGRGVCSTYNSRLMLGSELTDFCNPFLNSKESNKYQVYIYERKENEFWVVSSSAFIPVSVSVSTVGCFVSNVAFGNARSLKVTSFETGDSFTVSIIDRGLEYSAQFNFDSMPVNKSGVYDFALYSDGANTKSLKLSLAVVLETDVGEIERVIPEADAITIWVNDIQKKWYPMGGILGYPDIRAKKIKVYEEGDGVGGKIFDKSIDIELKSADKSNYSYAVKEFVELIEPTETTEGIDESVNEKKTFMANKVRSSVLNSLISFESDLVYYIGQGSDKVTGFAINTLEVSQGQFGQYPLIIFKENSTWALEQSASPDVLFGRITPIDATLGLKDERLTTNIGQTIFFANDSGIYALEGSVPRRISEPVQSIHEDIKNLSYQRLDNDKELLVSTSTNVYRYSIKYNSWYTSSEVVKKYFNDNERLYAIKSDNSVVDYQEELTTGVLCSVTLDHIHFGIPDTQKRIEYLFLRGDLDDENEDKLSLVVVLGDQSFSSVKNNIGSKRLLIKYRSVYDFKLVANATMIPGVHNIHKLDCRFKVRYPRKLRGNHE